MGPISSPVQSRNKHTSQSVFTLQLSRIYDAREYIYTSVGRGSPGQRSLRVCDLLDLLDSSQRPHLVQTDRRDIMAMSAPRLDQQEASEKNVGPIRHCELPHAALPFTRCRYYRTPPAHRCPQQRRRRRRQQRQYVTEGIAMAP